MRSVSKEEVKTSVFFIGSDKAAGPDGFNGHFFKAAWNIIKDDLVISVQRLFLLESAAYTICADEYAIFLGLYSYSA
ncbi:uncharacterized protein LOC126659934 isoform X2 [Mercurialis annua]|uniref:uncharacterized protein LOC126659934 isoform X2 n=1 Tax=Mercurialis annua TaxID=3986 RepID=UPI00215F15EE|nr:uncharacterized protein LOC126659934 isoform X2 [Mercurialis annua]